jgi:hypothetical protein
MDFNGHIKTLSSVKQSDTVTALQSLLKTYIWYHDPCVAFNSSNDPAFTDSYCIHFTPTPLMCCIRSTYSQNYTKSTLDLIALGEILASEMHQLVPDHYHLKSHMVGINPNGKQTRHRDNGFYHAHSKRLVTPIMTTSLAKTNFDDANYTLEVGTIYEMNNRIHHWSENNDSSMRVFLFADFIPPEYVQLLKDVYKFSE